MKTAMALEFTSDVPPLFDGPTDRAKWESIRGPFLLDQFSTRIYGRMPPGSAASVRINQTDSGTMMMEGRAIRRMIEIVYSGPGGEGRIRVLAFFPVGIERAPATLFICNRDPETNLDPARERKTPFWPAEEIIRSGYAAVAFHTGDVDPDEDDGFRNGIHGVTEPDPSKRRADSWATITAWGWGASRVMDWMETEPKIDAKRVMLVGHSRGGKTALWCGANDRRFAMVVSNNSGCAGAKLFRARLPESETVAMINNRFPHWFCRNFRHYDNNEDALPVDQHMLVGLIAPRLVYVTSAAGDAHAGPRGEFETCVLASPVWQLYGQKGLTGDTFPPVNSPLDEGGVGYHVRAGEHDLKVYDWQQFMRFADRHWNRKSKR